MTLYAPHPRPAAPPSRQPVDARPAVRLLGLATLQPASVSQGRAAELAQAFCGDESRQRLLPALFRRTRVDRRASVLLQPAGEDRQTTQDFYPPSQAAGDLGPTTAQRMARYQREAMPLAVEVARGALDQACLPPAAITHLITVTCTGFTAPGIDLALMQGLPLAPTVARTQVGFMGCHGAINGLRVAQAIVESDPAARVLLVAVELCSLHFRYGWDPQKLVANALFADGAAAAVLGTAPQHGRNGPGAAHASGWRLADTASCLFPDSAGAMTWSIGDHGFEMTLDPQVPELIEGHLRPWLEPWLAERGLKLADVPAWAIHPGGPRILDSVGKALDLPESRLAPSAEVLRQCGNMSSPTVLFILQRLQQGGHVPPCLVLAFGPGLVSEAALLTG